MEQKRRDFISSFATMGIVGASTAALAASARANAQASDTHTSLHGRGTALEGPYLDLRTGRGNQLAKSRLQGNLDFGQQKYFWFKGYIMGVRPHQKIDDLMGCQGFGAIRLLEGPNGTIRRLCRELIIYTDARSGEVLEEWDNPYTNERVKVVHVGNDPINFVFRSEFRPSAEAAPVPFVLPWYQHGPWLEAEEHVHILYPNPLNPEKWKRESAGPMVAASEFFAYHVRAEDMQNADIPSLDYLGNWNRYTPWLPWMLMGQTPGHCTYAAFFGGSTELEPFLSRSVLDHVEKTMPQFLTAPREWSDVQQSSIENYSLEEEPAS